MQQEPTYKADIYQSEFSRKGSRIVFGTSGIGGVWGDINKNESVDCILYALEHGISSLDTAPSYRFAEELVGEALSQWDGELPFVSTKVGRLKTDSAFDAKLDFSPDGMKDSVKRSLDLLKIDAVDLLFLHEPQWVPVDRYDEVFDTLLELVESGYARMLGIGGNPSDEFMPRVRGSLFKVVSTYCRLNACNLSAFEEEIRLYQSENIAIYAASPLHFALLGDGFEDYVNGRKQDIEFVTDQDINKAIAVNEIAKKYDIGLSSLAQRYLFSMEEATRVVIGARNLQQIVNSVDDWNEGALDRRLFEEVTQTITET